MANKVAIYPGSFDPVTNGHIDLIRRAARLFDKVVVTVANNSSKTSLFSPEQRVEFLKRACDDIENVEVDYFSGLLYKEVEKRGAVAVVRGLRSVADFEWEAQMASMNRELSRECETVFLTASPEFSFVSSSMVKEVAILGGEFAKFVPDFVAVEVRKQLPKK